jgi:hypothetical protein
MADLHTITILTEVRKQEIAYRYYRDLYRKKKIPALQDRELAGLAEALGESVEGLRGAIAHFNDDASIPSSSAIRTHGQIALAHLLHNMRTHGLGISSEFKRDMGNVAARIGISQDELFQFIRTVMVPVAVESFLR